MLATKLNPSRLLRSPSADYWIDGDDWIPARYWSGAGLEISFTALGLVRLRVRERRTVLLWDVDAVDPAGLEQALDGLTQISPDRRCELRYLRGGWIDESYPRLATAITRAREIQSSRDVVTLFPGISMTRRPLDDLDRAHPSLLDAFRTLATTSPLDWARSPAGRAGILFDCTPSGLVYRHVGDRSEIRRCLGDSWWRTAVGRPVNDAFVDDEFNCRTNLSYEIARREGQPSYEHVVALVNSRARRVILPFDRLTVPMGNQLAVIVRFRNGVPSDGTRQHRLPSFLEVA